MMGGRNSRVILQSNIHKYYAYSPPGAMIVRGHLEDGVSPKEGVVASSFPPSGPNILQHVKIREGQFCDGHKI